MIRWFVPKGLASLCIWSNPSGLQSEKKYGTFENCQFQSLLLMTSWKLWEVISSQRKELIANYLDDGFILLQLLCCSLCALYRTLFRMKTDAAEISALLRWHDIVWVLKDNAMNVFSISLFELWNDPLVDIVYLYLDQSFHVAVEFEIDLWAIYWLFQEQKARSDPVVRMGSELLSRLAKLTTMLFYTIKESILWQQFRWQRQHERLSLKRVKLKVIATQRFICFGHLLTREWGRTFSFLSLKSAHQTHQCFCEDLSTFISATVSQQHDFL